jgi:hypothetical protein
VSAASVPTPEANAPKLLLDTNVFRDLADGTLAQFEQRLVNVAWHRSPPLLWACPITFDEIVCHIRAEEADRFEHFREALRWMDRLCGNLGMAEDLPWVLRRGVFTRAVSYDGVLSTVLNWARRRLIKVERFADVPEDLIDNIGRLRAQSRENIEAWNGRRRQMQKRARVEPKPGEPRVEGTVAASGAVLVVSRRHVEVDLPVWGPFRSDDDQRMNQREMAAFELSHLLKARHRQGYNVQKHEGDYNDGWLVAYTAAGYHLVTGDRRLRRALEMGECKDPRVLDVHEALDVAEAWLAGSIASAND